MNFSDRWIEATAEKISSWPTGAVTTGEPPRQIFLDDQCTVFALVSARDYAWASQWRWSWRWDRTKQKRYAMRNTWEGPLRVTVYLHKAILNHSDKKQPSALHTIGDHQNGESLDCRLENLEWATPSMNRRNRRR